MFRQLVGVGLVAIALIGASPSRANVSIGINLGAPPPLVAVPASPVLYAPDVAANYFSYAGQYYTFTDGAWYVAAGFNGPWTFVEPELVPRPLLLVPVRYYHARPVAWAHWHGETAPRWEPRWGRRWEEPREGRHASHEMRREHR